MDLRELEWQVLIWINLAEDRGQWRSVVETEITIRIT